MASLTPGWAIDWVQFGYPQIDAAGSNGLWAAGPHVDGIASIKSCCSVAHGLGPLSGVRTLKAKTAYNTQDSTSQSGPLQVTNDFSGKVNPRPANKP